MSSKCDVKFPERCARTPGSSHQMVQLEDSLKRLRYAFRATAHANVENDTTQPSHGHSRKQRPCAGSTSRGTCCRDSLRLCVASMCRLVRQRALQHPGRFWYCISSASTHLMTTTYDQQTPRSVSGMLFVTQRIATTRGPCASLASRESSGHSS